MMKKIIIWWRANFCDDRYWRVTYSDGSRTFPLCYHEAKGLYDCFGKNGKLWIDYELPC